MTRPWRIMAFTIGVLLGAALYLATIGASIAMFAGSQHVGSTIADMDIAVTDLELVV